MPVEVVGGEVEDGGGVHAQARRPVQLVAGELDGEDVVRLVGEDHVDQRDADVADGRGAQTGRLQDRGEHPDGGRLAVGAGDREPGGRVGAAQPPGQFDVAPDGDAGLFGGAEERAGGLPAGGGDHQLGALGEGLPVAEADGDAQRPKLGGLGALAFAVAAVDRGDAGAEAGQGAGGGYAAHAEAGDGDVLAVPVHLMASHPA